MSSPKHFSWNSDARRLEPSRAGWTKRTAGQQPADALKKFSAGGGSRAVSREVRRCNRLTAGAVIEGKYQQTLRATGNWKRGESGGEKAGTAVSLRLASLCAVKGTALPIGYTSDSACPKTHFMPVVSHFHKDISWECERSVRLPPQSVFYGTAVIFLCDSGDSHLKKLKNGVY